MEENDTMEGKDLALNEVIKEAFKQKIDADKKEEENFVNPVLQIGGTSFELEVKRDEKDNKYKMHILGVHILTLDENNELQFNDEWEKELSSRIKEYGDMIDEQDGKDLIESLKQIDKEIQEKNEQKAEKEKDEKDLSEDLEEKEEDSKEEEPKKEEENKKKNNDSAKWQEMDLDREFSNSDTLRVWIKDVLGVAPNKVYRKQTGPHDFEYVAETNGEYEPLDLSTDQEGKNTMQQVYIVKEDGTLELDEVDSLLLTKDGNYGIATKVPDGIATDVTKSFEVKRTKDGKYVATQLIEKTGPYRDANQAGKEIADRDRSIYDIEEDLDEVENAENSDMEIAEDGVTVEEIDIIQELKKEGYKDKEIDNIIKRIQENDMSLEDSKKIEDRNRDEDNQKTPWGDAESRRSRW